MLPALSAVGSALGGAQGIGTLMSGVGALGSLFGGDDEAEAMKPWKPLRPYIKGKGDIPAHIAGSPLINTNCPCNSINLHLNTISIIKSINKLLEVWSCCT